MSDSTVVMTESVERVHTELWRDVRKAGVEIPPLAVIEEKGRLRCCQPVIVGDAFTLSFLCDVNARHKVYAVDIMFMDIDPVLRMPESHLLGLDYKAGVWSFRAERSGFRSDWNTAYSAFPRKGGPITDDAAAIFARFLSRFSAAIHRRNP